MSKNSLIELFGTITEQMHDFYSIKLDNKFGQIVKAKLSGKMRLNKINLQPGDYVKVEVSPYDLSLGRIVTRINKNDIEDIRAGFMDNEYGLTSVPSSSSSELMTEDDYPRKNKKNKHRSKKHTPRINRKDSYLYSDDDQRSEKK